MKEMKALREPFLEDFSTGVRADEDLFGLVLLGFLDFLDLLDLLELFS